MARVSVIYPVVKTTRGSRYLMTPTAFVGLDNGYTVLRKDLKDVFNSGTNAFGDFILALPVQTRVTVFLGGQEFRVQNYKVENIRGRLKVGCNWFNAATRRQITKWALS